MAKQRDLTPMAFVREFLELFGSRRGMELVGFSVLYRMAGYPRPGDLGRRGFYGLTKSSVYRAFADLRRFRLHLVDQGYERLGITDEASNTYEGTIDELQEDSVIIPVQLARRRTGRPDDPGIVDRPIVDAIATLVPESAQSRV